MEKKVKFEHTKGSHSDDFDSPGERCDCEDVTVLSNPEWLQRFNSMVNILGLNEGKENSKIFRHVYDFCKKEIEEAEQRGYERAEK